ncbi:endolytic transglycosylase MltG [Candidatus Kaiserbacteria bacterium]|nr:endolytic transglycosylase MltG [Candidatus Kaiserbacteria bacterium]
MDRLQLRLSERWVEHTNRRTLVIIIVIGIIATFSYLFLIRPPDNFPLDHLVSVPDGQSLKQIGDTLQKQGVVRSSLAFRVMATILGKGRHMRAGDYLFKEPQELFSVARTISIGAYGLEPIHIRIPEGATTRQMAVIFRSQLERFDQANFLVQAQPMEGYLFPDTYFFLPNATEETVIKTMRQNFDAHITEIQDQIEASGHSLSDIIIMASILEREATGKGDDRQKIAGVLWNRLSKNMPLQVDVTFLYTVGKGTFDLTRQDLKSDSPYNTYTHKGLPPTPIGSPSMNAIEAAVDPIKSDYLFYLADENGVTHYSKTYQQHLIKKDAYIDN